MWDFFVGILILYSLIVVPLQVGLNIRYGLVGRSFDYFIDVLFAIDMGLTFLTAYEEDGKMRRNYPDIAKNYLRTWFLPDFVSTFPFDVIVAGTSESTLRTFKLVRVLRLFRLLKLLRILRLNRKLKETRASDSVHPVVTRIAALFTYIFFVAHLLACAYYFVADCEHFPDDETAWRVCGHRQSPPSHYLASLYFVMTAVFGVGYGDVVITTTRGRLFSIFVMFVGSITFGFIVATVSECVETWNPKITARKRKMDEMLDYCNERELKIPLKIAILRHFDYFYHKSSLFSEQSILQSMPILLHQSLLEHSRENCLNHLNLFQKEEHSTLTHVLPHLKPAFVDPREMIVAEHDYLVDMIFIMRGTIHATLQNERTQDRLVLVGIFGPGSDFGASNAFYCNSLCWATYRATVLTDVMWLRYEVIQDSAGRMKELFKRRAEEEEKNQEEVLHGIHKSEEVGSVRVPSFILCDGQVITSRHAIRMLGGGDHLNDNPTAVAKVYKTVYMRGYNEDGLPNFVEDQETTIQMRLRYVINPFANYKLKFDMLVAIFALFSTVTIPLRLGLKLPPHLAWNIVDLITETLFFVDMVASFFTAYEQSDYSLNTIHSHIARRYIKSWFFIDLLSSVPFYRLSKAAKYLQALVLCKILRVIRIFRLASVGKLFRFVNTRDTVAFNSEMIALRDGLNRIYYSIGFVALFTHLCACFWSWLVLPATGRTWASELDIDNSEYLTKYIAATYWSYTTLSTVGYGDVVSENDSERMYTILIFITGSSLLAYVVGLVRAYAFNRNGSRSAQEEKLNLVRHYLAEQGISKSLKEVIIKHFTYYLEQNTPYNQREIWGNLPHHLRQEAIIQSYAKISHQFTSFHSHFQKSSVFTMLLKFMEPAKVSRGSYIYTFETGCDGMYFILEGTVEIIDEDDSTGKEIIVAQIRKGMFFGHEKILGLTTDFLGVRALTPLKMLHLRTRHLEHLRRYLPLVYSALSRAITQSLQPEPPQSSAGAGTRGGTGSRPRGVFGAEDQKKLAELLSNPEKMKESMQQRRGYSRHQSSIEEVIEWLAEDMDEMLPTERGGLLMGEVCNPNDPTKILSLNSQDRYRAMRNSLKESSLVSIQRIDENESEGKGGAEGDGKEEEKKKRGEGGERINSKLIQLLKSGKKHYHKLQINFHPRRPAVETKYRVRSLHDSQNDSKAGAAQEGGASLGETRRSNDLLTTDSKVPLIDQSALGMTSAMELGSSPPPLREENSYHFDASSDSDSDSD